MSWHDMGVRQLYLASLDLAAYVSPRGVALGKYLGQWWCMMCPMCVCQSELSDNPQQRNAMWRTDGSVKRDAVCRMYQDHRGH